ncbi:hypothetical protein ACHE_70938A [Aspergillus chevalieri]|nr:hypothetical protein ACHE_70938A [Aspergillus chevalieri]
MVRANVPRSQLGSQGHDHAHKVGHRRPAGRVLPSPPSLPTGEDRASTVPQARRGPGAPLGHPVPGITTPQATQGPGRATHHRPSPPFPSNTVNWQRAGHIGIAPPGTQALRLTLSGQGPRPAHPANWRQVLDVERRPSSTGDARGRSLGQQGYLTAYTTRLVTSVVCRGFIPARGDIAIRQPAPRGFSLGAVASLLRSMARRPIRIQLRRAGRYHRVPARILT